MTSWVIVERSTGKAIVETFNPLVVTAKLKPEYKCIPILEYLVEFNRSTKNESI